MLYYSWQNFPQLARITEINSILAMLPKCLFNVLVSHLIFRPLLFSISSIVKYLYTSFPTWWVLFLVHNEIKKIWLENCRALCNSLLTISHGEIFKSHSILVHAKFWNFGHFPQFYFSAYIFIDCIVFPIYSMSYLSN